MSPRRTARDAAGAAARALQPDEPAKTTGAPSTATPENLTKYSVLLDPDSNAIYDQLAASARRELGRRVTKSELLRALLVLVDDDAALRGQVFEQVRAMTAAME